MNAQLLSRHQFGCMYYLLMDAHMDGKAFFFSWKGECLVWRCRFIPLSDWLTKFRSPGVSNPAFLLMFISTFSIVVRNYLQISIRNLTEIFPIKHMTVDCAYYSLTERWCGKLPPELTSIFYKEHIHINLQLSGVKIDIGLKSNQVLRPRIAAP